MVSRLILALLYVVPASASLTITSASVGSAGLTFTVGTNSTTALTGSTASCISLSGGAGQFGAVPTVTISGTSLTVIAASPAYAGQTITVSMAANPACALTGSSGNAATSAVTATDGSDYYAGGDAHWSGLITVQGDPLVGSDGNGYPNTLQFSSATGSVDMTLATGGTLATWDYTGTGAITLITDGVLGTRQTLSGSQYSETAWSVTGGHTYRLEISYAQSSYAGIQAIRCTGCSFSTPPATRPVFTECGASVVDITGGGGATANADQTHYGLLGQAFGATAQGLSSSGQPLYTNLEGICPGGLTLGGGSHPSFAFMEPDSNDIAYSVSLANYQGAAQTATTNIMAKSGAPIKLFWIAPNVTNNLNTSIGNCPVSAAACYASYTTALAAGVAAAANVNTIFVHTAALPNGGPDWLNRLCDGSAGADLQQSDCLHPNAATAIGQPGYGRFANREAPIVAGIILGSSFTVSGPTTGTPGVASSPFTSTIAGSSAGVTWMDIVTISSSGGGDTICIVGGACGTGSVQIPGNLAASTFQFTVKAPTAGARTISYSGLPDGWLAAASSTFTASGQQPTYIMLGRLTK